MVRCAARLQVRTGPTKPIDGEVNNRSMRPGLQDSVVRTRRGGPSTGAVTVAPFRRHASSPVLVILRKKTECVPVSRVQTVAGVPIFSRASHLRRTVSHYWKMVRKITCTAVALVRGISPRHKNASATSPEMVPASKAGTDFR